MRARAILAMVACAAAWVALGVPAAQADTPFSWSSPAEIDTSGALQRIACVASGLCVSGDDAGYVASSTDPARATGTWSVFPIVGTPSLVDTSCTASGGLCVVVDSQGVIWESTTPGQPPDNWSDQNNTGYGVLSAVSCAPGGGLCVATEGGGSILYSTDPSNRNTWTTVTAETGDPTFDAVSCPSTGLCIAVDNGGNVLTTTDPTGNALWTITPVALDNLRDIACASTSFCAAVDLEGNVYTSTNPAQGVWSAATDIDGSQTLAGIACPTASLCVAVDDVGNAITSTNPTGGAAAWSSQTVASSGQMIGISCGSTTQCVISDDPTPGMVGGDVIVGSAAAPAATTTAASEVTGTAATLGGTVNPQGSRVTDCHFDWGTTTAYGNSAPCAGAPGNGRSAAPESAALTGLTPGTTYHYRISATSAVGQATGSDGTLSTTTPSQPPAVTTAAPTVMGSGGAGFNGTVNPDGLATSAHFEYGLDPKYAGGGPVVYDQSTASQAIGSDFTAHAFSTQVSGLVPNALYHVRLVATNSAGTTSGPDETFTTGMAPAPPPPTIGQTANVDPISGVVLIKPPAGKTIHALQPFAVVNKGVGFIPLTQARQVPVGSQIDARRGTLSLVDANGHARHTQTARLTGGLFTLGQTKNGVSKGLTTFTLNAGGFPGAPTYASCPKVGKSLHADDAHAQAAKLSAKILQTLRASDNHGKFRTKGRYSAGTVRGTDFTTTERCDGTLTHVRKGTVDVLNFRLRRTIAVHAGHSYLASAVATKAKHRHGGRSS